MTSYGKWCEANGAGLNNQITIILFKVPMKWNFCPLFILFQTQRTVNKTSWSNPRQTRICYIFRLWVTTKALLKKFSLYLLSHFHIRILVLTYPDNKSERNQPKSCVPAMQNHTNHNDVRPILFQLKSSLPFSLFLFVWRLESTTTKSLLRLLSPLQKISTV